MDDINFEELDKAVNSALQQSAPKTAPPQEETPVAVPEAVPPLMKDESTGAAERQSVTETTPPKRRGQFMDMVHPSSDMIRPSAVLPSRQAATIQPLDPVIINEAGQKVPEREPEPAPQDEVGTEDHSSAIHSSVVSEDEPALKSEWPDPLDVMEQTEQERQGDAPTALDESATPISDIANEEESDVSVQYADHHAEIDADNTVREPEEATTPFISGADLEKRPLGAFTSTDTVSDEVASEDATEPSHTDETHDSLPDNVREDLPMVPVPQELTPEVVSVESDDPSRSPEETEGDPVPDEATPDTVGMTASISPQYKNTESSSDDQGDHPVFDTKDYHQPLTPPSKRSHAGLIITLVIVVLALLGACAWYAIAVLKLV